MKNTMESLWRNQAPRHDAEARLVPASGSGGGLILGPVRDAWRRFVDWFVEY